MNLNKLPESDNYGNYWLNEDQHIGEPAIFPFKGGPRQKGKYYISLGDDYLWSGGRLAEFDTPLMALKELRRRLG